MVEPTLDSLLKGFNDVEVRRHADHTDWSSLKLIEHMSEMKIFAFTTVLVKSIIETRKID